MSYGILYTCTHKANTNGNETTYTIEVLKKSYPGLPQELVGWEETFSLEYDRINVREPFKNPINEARMEFYVAIRSSDELDLLNEVFSGDEDDHQLRLKQNGTVVWTGFILKDLMQYSNGDYPYKATIVAKDLTRLSQFTFPLQDIRQKLIVTIADLLDDLGYGLDIYTYTNWDNDSFTTSDDFLNLTYHETEAMRDYKESGYEDDVAQTNRFWLESILRNFGLILRQAGGVWRIYQLSGLTDSESVSEYKYNSAGVQQSSSSADISSVVDESSVFILPSSTNYVHPAIKQANVVWNHRTPISGIQIPDQFIFTGADSETYTQFFLSDGTQTIEIALQLTASYPSQPASGELTGNFDIYVNTTGTDYYLNNDGEWVTTPTTINVELFDRGSRVTGGSTEFTAIGTIFLSSMPFPSGADGELTIKFYSVSGASFTTYRILDYELINSTDEENSDSIAYALTQTGNYSYIYDHGTVYFGDGPVKYAKSALRYSSANDDVIADGWKRVGEGTSGNFFKLLLREFVELQASGLRLLEAEMYGPVGTAQMLLYESTDFFMLGGTFRGDNTRQIDYLAINYSTPTTTFSELVKKETAQGLPGGSGIDSQVTSDIFLQKANDLSDVADAATARENLGVEIGVDVQGFDQNLEDISGLAVTDGNIIVGNGSNFVAESGNTARTSLGLGTGDSPSFAGLTVDTDTLYVDSVNNRVGIGTTSPQDKLHLNGPSDQDYKILFSENNGLAVSLFYEGSAGIGQANNFHIRRELSGQEANLVTIGLDGDVGIGTSTPANKLDVNGGIDADTLNTGQGDNELYAMDQNVRTTDSPTFSKLTLSQTTGTAPMTISSTTVVTNLNADLLDGVQATSFLRSDADDTYTGTITGPYLRLTSTTDATPTSTLHAFQAGLTNSINLIIDNNEIMVRDNGVVSQLNFNPDGGNVTIHNNTTAGIFTIGGQTIWHQGNDGSGSGLDADLLDGQHGSYYLDYDNFTGTPPAGDAAGTDGQVQYNNGGSLAGASGLYYDDTNSRVGIGTTSPDGKLHISSGTTGDAILIIEADTDNNNEADNPKLWFKQDGDVTEGAIQLNNDGTLNTLDIINNVTTFGGIRFLTGTTGNTGTTDPSTGSSERMRITSGGNVGIGTTNVQAKLHVAKSSVTKYIDAFSTAVIEDTEARLQIVADDGGGNAGAITLSNGAKHWTIHHRGPNVGNYLAIGYVNTTSTTDIVNSAMSNLIAMSINTSGNVGIGTTSPSAKLDIQDGNIGLIVGADASATTRTNSTNKSLKIGMPHYLTAEEPVAMMIGTSLSGANIIEIGGGSSSMNAATGIILRTKNSATSTTSDVVMHVAAGAVVGINKLNPNTTLDVNGDVTITDKIIHDGDTNTAIRFPAADTFAIETAGSERVRVDSTGRVGIATTSPSAELTVNGSAVINVDLDVFGALSKGSGSFRIPHPDPEKPTKELWHSFVEAPTAGENIYRWQVEVKDGIATLLLPDYYKHLNENHQVWVSPVEHFGQAYGKVTENEEYLVINANADGPYNVLLIGTRKDPIAKKAWKGAERDGNPDYLKAAKNYNSK